MIQIREEWLEMESTERVIFSPGEYRFKVTKAEPQTSRAGNQMIVLQLLVKDDKTTTTVFDHLVGTEKAFWKVKNFCKSVGISSVLVPDGKLDSADCVDRTGTVLLTIEPAEDGYPEKNVVDNYAIPPFSAKEPDDIPF